VHVDAAAAELDDEGDALAVGGRDGGAQLVADLATLSLPSLSTSWSRSMRASDLAPMSMNTLSAPISTTTPSTSWPGLTRRAPRAPVPFGVASNIAAKSSSCWAAMGG
jgi:hypothetical protein